ncbi:unnamed protein product [Arctia plantaginis]|uniref:Bacterial surface antigen (D15) domain-containing protein n=1 Tax=Arctia plantaginis TaxID=874455 RepID=A0A8S1B9E0_ARCPL|nr:unnamed protein product [Arctia plantaginis]
MGTVHAKSEPSSGDSVGAGTGTGLFEFEEPLEIDDEPVSKPTIKLNGVRARVDRVHVDGLSRTKDDVIRSTVDELFHATDFEDVILRAHKVRRALDAMGCFREIGVLIDVSSGPDATPEGLEVTFQVRELSRVVGGVNTTVSENEGNLVLGVKMPNVLGRGEKLQAEYSMGYRSSSNFSIAATKPYPQKPLVPVLSATVYQQNHEYPWSGYRLLDRGLLLDVAFKTSPVTKHNIQWEGLVRDTSVLSKTTSFKVRESSGPQMKSILRHIVAANAQLIEDVVLQGTCALGVLHDVFGTELPDHLYLGGPTTLRGFRQRGVGPHSDGQATGGRMYWASGLHVFAPLPFVGARGGLGALFRSHVFVNAGCLAAPDAGAALAALGAWRAACGAGVCVRLGRVARLELNYCVPLRALPHDAHAPGLQFGVGADFL